MRRPRGPGGRFLTASEIQAMREGGSPLCATRGEASNVSAEQLDVSSSDEGTKGYGGEPLARLTTRV